MKPPTLILATGNPGKVAELRDLFATAGLALAVRGAEACGGMPQVAEDAPDFAGNARKKAEALRVAAPTCWILADDSGLEVDALHGEPGVRSARYAGEGAGDAANLDLLLRNLAHLPPGSRTARFRCCLCLLPPQGRGAPLFCEGACEGRILAEPRGQGGFGYDPVFVPEGETRTFAEMTRDEKAGLSHRGRALRRLVRRMRDCGLAAGGES